MMEDRPPEGRRPWAARPVLWIAGLLIAGAAVSYPLRPRGTGTTESIRSGLRTTPDGVAALARAIERMGRPVAFRRTPWADADPLRGTLVLLEPRRPPSPRETRAVLNHVRDGGTLVYAPRYNAGTVVDSLRPPLMDSLGVLLRARSPFESPLAARGQTSHGIRGALHPRWTASPACPYCNVYFTICNPWFTIPVSLASLCVAPWPGSAATNPSSRLASGALRASRCSREIIHGLPWTQISARWADHPLADGMAPPQTYSRAMRVERADVRGVLVATESAGEAWLVAAELRLGAGRVLALADAAPLANAEADDDPLAVLAARAALAWTPPGDSVFFAEFHQGIDGRRSQARVLTDFFFGSSTGRTLAQLAAVGLLALACAGVRFGSPMPLVAPPDRERRSPLEHVSALGDLYRKAGIATTSPRPSQPSPRRSGR